MGADGAALSLAIGDAMNLMASTTTLGEAEIATPANTFTRIA